MTTRQALTEMSPLFELLKLFSAGIITRQATKNARKEFG